ncbi:hypothetical protein Godav_029134 [Gossypium davidsonii]|uniref:LOB domain-containing protein n=1 Tax=Gossypium davidsonii TaxID=34287 RepID=A0A7J8TDP2_GOSDV|nr:hypothetical protein [Gossypium davidsonii]
MGSGSSPCASCKLLRRRCAKDCIFAPYFPSDDPHKFAIVHKVFGASNVSKMLQMQLAVAQTEILCIQMQHHQEDSALALPTQMQHHDDDDYKPFLLPTTHNLDNISQYINFASSSNVIQDPAATVKRESLWT